MHIILHLVLLLLSTSQALVLVGEPSVKPISQRRIIRALVPAHHGHRPRSVEALLRRNGHCEEPGDVLCDEPGHNGCCPQGYVCDFAGANKIPSCCPEGVNCEDTLPQCPGGQELCGDICCLEGATCMISDLRELECVSAGQNPDPTPSQQANGCPAGAYDKCPQYDGCCPRGIECLDGGICDLKCTSEDVPCGDGCCLKGFVCETESEMCFPPTTEVGTVSSSRSSTKAATAKTPLTPVGTATEEDDEPTKTSEPKQTSSKSDSTSMQVPHADAKLWVRISGTLVGLLLVGVAFL